MCDVGRVAVKDFFKLLRFYIYFVQKCPVNPITLLCLNKLKATQIINGKNGDDDILKEFSSCYQNIYQPNTLGLDSQFADRVKVLLDDRRQCESDADSSRAPVIDIDMLHDCVQS